MRKEYMTNEFKILTNVFVNKDEKFLLDRIGLENIYIYRNY